MLLPLHACLSLNDCMLLPARLPLSTCSSSLLSTAFLPLPSFALFLPLRPCPWQPLTASHHFCPCLPVSACHSCLRVSECLSLLAYLSLTISIFAHPSVSLPVLSACLPGCFCLPASVYPLPLPDGHLPVSLPLPASFCLHSSVCNPASACLSTCLSLAPPPSASHGMPLLPALQPAYHCCCLSASFPDCLFLTCLTLPAC